MSDIKEDIQEALGKRDLKKFSELLIKLDEMGDVEIREWAYRKGDEVGIFENNKIVEYKKIAEDAIKDGGRDVMMSALDYLTDEKLNLREAIGKLMMEGKHDLAIIAERREDFANELIDKIGSVYTKKYLVEEPKITPAEKEKLRFGLAKQKGLLACARCRRVVGTDYVVHEGRVYCLDCYGVVTAEVEDRASRCSLCGEEFDKDSMIDIVPGTQELAHQKCIKEAGLK